MYFDSLKLKEFQFIKQVMTPRSLIIVDELCRGTSCEEGTAIAWVIMEQLMEEDAFIFLTTHFLYLTKMQELFCNVTKYVIDISTAEILRYEHNFLIHISFETKQDYATFTIIL
jgi:DNA mismatch repair ATPase MutS